MSSEQGGQPERRIGRFLKSKVLGRRRVTLVVLRQKQSEQCAMARRKYRLSSSPGRYITGRMPDGGQILMGVCCPGYEIYFFETEGNFTRGETRFLSVSPSLRNGVYCFDPEATTSLERDVANWKADLSVTECSIELDRFCSDNASIEDLPSELIQFQDDPGQFPEQERKELLEWKTQWIDLGLFVLWWGDELWIDRNGDVVSS